jgi:hypothetical protein
MPKINLGHGLEVTLFEPPPHGFDPLTARPAELERHGFPRRPTNPRQLARYTRVMNQLKGRFQYVSPTFRIDHETLHGPRKRLLANGTEITSNWSGGVVFAPAGESFQWI